MTPRDDASAGRDFFSVAGDLALLSPQSLSDLAAEAAGKHASPSQLALQKGLLDATQIEIIETLLRPVETVPGYEILSLLGRGGMGVVYRAQQLNLQRTVALKTVLVSQLGSGSAIDRFEREARAVARLTHPHIIAAYDFGRHEGRVFFAMELVAGRDVLQLIEHKGALNEWTAWGLVRQAAAGLAHAAEHGIVHRDIKPANLLLVEPPAGFPLPEGLPLVKIADFGLARLAAASDVSTRLTAVDVTVGSPHYMAPEQLAGEPVDQRADIFALGATAFHMLAGRPPLAGKTLTQIFAHKMSGQTESLLVTCAAVSHASADLVAAMMAHDPNRRIADYRELTRRIDALGLESPADLSTATMAVSTRGAITAVSASPSPVSDGSNPPSKRRGLGGVTAGIATVAAALLVWGFFAARPSFGERDLAPTGISQDLFSGQDIIRWATLSGGWGPAKNQEGAGVLQGRGVIRRPLASPGDAPLPAHYNLTFVVDLHDASAVELQFDIGEAGDRRWLARIDRQGSSFGERLSDRGAPRIAASLGSQTVTAGLHAVQVERQSRGWWVFVDGQYLASAPFLHPDPPSEFRLLAEGGNAWFSDFTIEELAPAPGRSQGSGPSR